MRAATRVLEARNAAKASAAGVVGVGAATRILGPLLTVGIRTNNAAEAVGSAASEVGVWAATRVLGPSCPGMRVRNEGKVARAWVQAATRVLGCYGLGMRVRNQAEVTKAWV